MALAHLSIHMCIGRSAQPAQAKFGSYMQPVNPYAMSTYTVTLSKNIIAAVCNHSSPFEWQD